VKQKMLDIIYNLDIEPLTFDLIYSLCIAELHRITQNLDGCRFYAVHGLHDDFSRRSIRDKLYSRPEKMWRLYNLIIPATRLVASINCSAVVDDNDALRTVLASSAAYIPQEHFLDGNKKRLGKFSQIIYAAKIGYDVQHISAPEHAKHVMAEWISRNIGSKKLVTITLRQSKVQPLRNSNIESWIELYRFVEKQGLSAVFICDTEAILAGDPGIPSDLVRCDNASISLELRCALYELADLNFFVGNGPGTIATFNKAASYIQCKLIVEGDTYGATSLETYTKHYKLPPGTQIPNLQNPYGRFVWQTDDAEVLKEAFEDWLNTQDNEMSERN
jgi:hypothetical protein